MRRRLYLQIYLGFVAIVLLLLVVTASLWAWHMRSEYASVPPSLAGVAELVGERLPPADQPKSALEKVLRVEAERLALQITVWDADGEHLASTGVHLPAPPFDADGAVWIRGRRAPRGLAVRLDDGRWLGLALDRRRHFDPGGWLFGLALVAGVIAAGSYPIARRITRRLERLRSAVEQLGAGDLSARVPVEGRDEVRDLARSFNRAADRIQELVNAQRRMLASASHELRSPLTRLRVAVELMGSESRPELRAEAESDISELDALIEDLLIAARVESVERTAAAEPVDLLATAAEEAARVGAEVSGGSVVVPGDPRLLRRMVRNLLENARRYAVGSPIEVTVEPIGEAGEGARLTVADRGPGVLESDRLRVFEPFYRPEGHSEGRDGGIGLGLALVQEIARHHGGEARCRPRPGGGTLFEVDLLRTSDP
jgi:signal transduction histidine kinase